MNHEFIDRTPLSRIRRFARIALLTTLVPLLLGNDVGATSVFVDPGAYSTKWFVTDGTNNGYVGPATVDLPTGLNHFWVGSYGVIQFFLAADGTMTFTAGADAVIGGAGTLTLRNSSVTIDPSSYSGDWFINEPNGSTVFQGSQTLVLVPGLLYGMDVGSVGGRFFFRIQLDGTVTVDNGVSAMGGPGALTFNTVQISVDPGLYQGQWEIFGGIRAYAPGADVITVVPGVGPYGIRPGHGLNPRFYASVVPFAVDAVGNVTVTGHAAVGGAASLTLNTVPLFVDPGAFYGKWAIDEYRVRSAAPGPAIVEIVPDLRYVVHPGNIGLGRFLIDIDPAGNVTVVNGVSGAGGDRILRFNTTNVYLDASGFSSSWNVHEVTDWHSQSATLPLVPGVGYFLHDGLGAGSVFHLAEPCALDPAEIATPAGPIVLSCGLPDGDADGVPNDTDNCPDDPNADQVDLDLDGFGDVCDSDDDADGIVDDFDNCPQLANTDQADHDGDGTGDACDDDGDGDGVPDDTDNCLGLSNPDQANADGDAFGDSCDADDDNDGVVDESDNCPFAHNAEQADFDGDGDGDSCDGDQDSDGVANEFDLCPRSTLDRLVDADGCTGAQRIVLACQPSTFVQHGQYVSCVAHAAHEAVALGLITPQEKSSFVKEAARKN